MVWMNITIANVLYYNYVYIDLHILWLTKIKRHG